MKKLLIGLGIGFGVLVLGVIAVLVVGAFWLKGQVEDVTQGAAEFAEKAEAVEKKIADLDRRFPFQAPAKGVPVSITESRLQEYLAVRATLQPVFKTYEAKAKELEASAGDNPGFGDAMKAMGQLSSFLNTLRSTWLDGLEAKRMSPKEFHAISAALYTSNWGVAIGDFQKTHRPAIEEAKKSLQAQLASATEPALKQALEVQVAALDEQLAALPEQQLAPETERVHRANHELYTKYKTQIEEQTAHGLDLLLAGDSSSLGEAFEGIQGDTED